MKERYATYQAMESDVRRIEKQEKSAKKKKKKLEFEKWKNERLNRLRNHRSNYGVWIQGIFSRDMGLQEEAIASFMEQLWIPPEKWRNVFDTEKNKLVADINNDHDFDKSSMKKKAAMRKDHEELMQQMHYMRENSKPIKRLLFGDKDGGILQNSCQMQPKSFWAIVVAAIVTVVVLQFLHVIKLACRFSEH